MRYDFVDPARELRDTDSSIRIGFWNNSDRAIDLFDRSEDLIHQMMNGFDSSSFVENKK